MSSNLPMLPDREFPCTMVWLREWLRLGQPMPTADDVLSAEDTKARYGIAPPLSLIAMCRAAPVRWITPDLNDLLPSPLGLNDDAWTDYVVWYDAADRWTR